MAKRSQKHKVDGDRLRAEREERGWGQDHLSYQTGQHVDPQMCEGKISVRTIRRMESGENVSLESVRKIAEALGIKTQELLVEKRRKEDAKEMPEAGFRTGSLFPEENLRCLRPIKKVLKIGGPQTVEGEDGPEWFRRTGPLAIDFDDHRVYPRQARLKELRDLALGSSISLLEGASATGKTVLVLNLAYELYKSGELNVYYFDCSKYSGFDQGQLVHDIRSVSGLIIIENIHLELSKIQWVYSEFEHDPDPNRHILLTARSTYKSTKHSFSKDLTKIKSKLLIQPFDEVDRIIESFSTHLKTKGIPRDVRERIKGACSESFWLLAYTLKGYASYKGRGDPKTWYAEGVENDLSYFRQICPMFPQVLVALSPLYKDEVMTAQDFLIDNLGFNSHVLQDLAQRGEIIEHKTKEGDFFYGLPHSALADAYWEHGREYIQQRKLRAYEQFLYEYVASAPPNGLAAILWVLLRGRTCIPDNVLRRLSTEGKIQNVVENETSMTAVAEWRFLDYCPHPMDKSLMKILADKITSHDDFYSAGNCLMPLCSLVSDRKLKLWKLVDKPKLADRISRSSDFYGVNNLINKLILGSRAAASEFCHLLNLKQIAVNLEATPDPEDACAMISLVFQANNSKGKELWELVDRTKLAANLATRDIRYICFGLGTLFLGCDETGWEFWKSLCHKKLAAQLKAVEDVYHLTTCVKNFFQVYDDIDIEFGGLVDMQRLSGLWPLWEQAGCEFHELLVPKVIINKLGKSKDPKDDVILIAMICGTNSTAGWELADSMGYCRLLELMQQASLNPAMYGYICEICMSVDPDDMTWQFLGMIDEKELANRISNTKSLFREDKCIETISMMNPDAGERLCQLLNIDLLARNLEHNKESDSTRHFVKTIESANPEVGRRLHKLLYGE